MNYLHTFIENNLRVIGLQKYLQVFLFLFVGGVGLMVNLIVTYMLTEWISWWYLVSFLIGTLWSWTTSFLLNSVLTFKGHSKEQYGKKYLLFLLMYTAAFLVNTALVYTLTSIFSVYYLFSIMIAAVCTAGLTYFGSARYIYH